MMADYLIGQTRNLSRARQAGCKDRQWRRIPLRRAWHGWADGKQLV